MTNTDSFALIQFPQYPKLQASDLLDIQFDSSQTTIKTADLTYEGQGVKSTDLCGVLGFVDDQGHIHLSSNFDVYTMRPKLGDFNVTINKDETKLDVRFELKIDNFRFFLFVFLLREMILMKNLVLNKNVVLYIRKNVIQSKQIF